MADTVNKQYLDYAGLVEYDSKIKTFINGNDATTLKSAKDYADGLASNYDAAGSAASAQAAAEAAAKAYTDTEVTKANAAAAAADAKAVAAQSAAEAAQSAADKAQGEVDALESYVGTLPEGSAVTNVVAYIDKKTEGIASEGAMTELSGRVTVVEGKVATIEGDYLKTADKTELSSAIGEEVTRATGAESELSGRLEEVEAFFKLADGQQLDEALDTLVEIQKYITDEGAAADQMVLDIAANRAAIEKEVTDRGTAISGVETAYQAADEAIIARLEAVETELGDGEGSVSEQIAAAVAVEKQRAEGAEAALDAKIAANAAAAKAADDKAVAAQGEVDALEIVVAGKVAQTDHDALAGRVTTAEGKITTLEGKAHEHTNKTDLDGITAALITQWNEAYAKAHEHSNKDVLDGITSAKVEAWNNAESNAKAYTDTKIAEFTPIETSKIDGLFA